MQFWGYKRKEGRAGIRNHVLILPTCACGSELPDRCKSGARCCEHRVQYRLF